MKNKPRAFARIAVTALAVVAAPALAFAQEFQKFEGKAPEQIPAGPFLAGAYGFIWAAVLFYVIVVARGVGRVKTEIQDLRRKIDGR